MSPPVASPQDEPLPCPLLALPAELKNEIYRLATLQDDAVKVTANGYQRPALLNTCREIRSEALKVWYYESHFHVDLLNYNSDTVLRFCTSIRATGAALSKVNYKANIRYDLPSWNNLIIWLRRCHGQQIYVCPTPANLLRKNCHIAISHIVAMMLTTVKAMRDKPWENVEELMNDLRPSLVAQDVRWQDDQTD